MGDTPPTVPSATPAWHDNAGANHGPGAPGARRARRGRQLFLTLAALLAVAGAVFGFLLYLRQAPSPTFVALWITEYEDPNVPPIPYAEQDWAALLALPWQENNG